MYYLLAHDASRGVVHPVGTAGTEAEAETKVRDMGATFFLDLDAWDIAVTFDGLDDDKKDLVLDLLIALRRQ
jgi:hypothetical protein